MKHPYRLGVGGVVVLGLLMAWSQPWQSLHAGLDSKAYCDTGNTNPSVAC